MSEKKIAQELTIQSPRSQVFQALTDARQLERWFTTKAASQPESGGAFRYDWTFPDAPERNHLQEGRYLQVEAEGTLVYPWRVGSVSTRVAFSLEDSGESTILRLSHTGWEGAEGAYEEHAQGWSFFLGNLKSYLEDGVDRRAEALGMAAGA